MLTYSITFQSNADILLHLQKIDQCVSTVVISDGTYNHTFGKGDVWMFYVEQAMTFQMTVTLKLVDGLDYVVWRHSFTTKQGSYNSNFIDFQL